MGFINLAEKTVHAKLVYYGIGAGGKTTSLQSVHGIMCPSNEVKLVSIKTEQDATLLFDFLPINLGTVEGYQIIIQGFTVPGQPKYKRMRKYVLQGADAVVLVVDSQRSRLEENIEALDSLMDNLRGNGLDPDSIPIVIQYNKRDLDDILSEEEMNPHFLVRDDVQAFPSVATEYQGVYEAFVHAAGQLVETKIRQYDLGKGEVSAEDVSKSAKEKLWSIFDLWRCQQEENVKTKEVLEFTLDEDDGTTTGEVLHAADRLSETLADIDEDSADEDDWSWKTGLEMGENGEPASSAGAPAEPPTETSTETPFEAAECSETEEAAADGDARPSDEAVDEGDADADVKVAERPAEVAAPVLSDADLDFDLDASRVEEAPDLDPTLAEGEGGLLDMALQSNLQMAEAFGELDQYKAALRRKNEELIKITQNTIHDLNKPLSAIKLMLTGSIKGYFGAVDGKLASSIQNSLAAVEMMERLMGDLMDSIALDTTFKMKFAEVDIALVITDVLRTLRSSIEDNEVGLRVEPMPTIVADEWALTKAFMNLIGNSIQYASPDRLPRIRISYEDTGDYHCILVADNGMGIPKGQEEKLFLRFERGSNAAGISGSGLGLHIVKEAVMGHGGHIEVESEEGHGVTFKINLPKAPIEVPRSEVTQTVEI